MSGGWNPMSGRDASGTRPAGPPSGVPIASQGQAYIPYVGGPGYNLNSAPQYAPLNPFASGPVPYYTPMPGTFPTPYAVMPTQQPAMAGFHTQHTYSHQPNGTGSMYARQPQPQPHIDPSMPAAQMTNSSGGVGCEPGYNYFFPAEHTKIHVFKSASPPWQLPAGTQIPFIASHVPCDTTLGALLKGFGCTNPSAKMNKCFEVTNGGNGKFYSGFCFGGDEKDKLKKTIRDVGWDSSRTGLPDGKPVVCLWFCKG